MVYAIDKINKDDSILPNVTLGYDIRDFCQDPVIATGHGYEFAIASTMNCQLVHCYSDYHCYCHVNGSSVHNEHLGKNYSTTYPVAAIVGALTSRAAIPLANFLQSVQIPLIDSAATSEELSSSMYGSFFRTIPPDVNQAKAIADIIEHFGWRYAGIIAVDDSYGRHGAAALERESINRTTFCTHLVGYIPLSNYMEKLKLIVSFFKERQTVRVIVLWSHSFQGIDLLKEAAKQGLKNRVWIFSEALSMVKPEFFPLDSGLSSTGVHFGVQLPLITSNGYHDYIKDKLSQNKTNKTMHYWWREFWMTAASEKCPDTKNDVCNIKKEPGELITMVQDDFVPYIIDAVHTAAHALHHMFECLHPNGSKIADDKQCPIVSSTVDTNDVIRYLHEVRFKGITGTIEFGQNGDPYEALYDIVYFNITKPNGIEKVFKKHIGQWDKKGSGLTLNDDLISWKSDDSGVNVPSSTCNEECDPGQWKVFTTVCCWKCLPCVDGSVSKTHGAHNCTACTKTQMSNLERTECQDLHIGNVKWSDVSAIILIVISVFGIILDIFALVVFIRFRFTPIVKASNKVYSFVLLLGIALCFGMTILYIVRPSSELCSVLKPLRYIVYTLCCSALFLKTMQIVHAFNVSRLKDWIWVVICSTKRQVILLSLIIALEVLLGIVWIILDPPYVHVNIIPKSHVFHRCLPFKGVIGQIFEHLMLIYLISMAGLCTYYAYQARNLPANFSEAKYISFSLYIFLLSWVTYYPIDYSLEGWYVGILSGATILLSSYGLLGCIFVPKLNIIIRHPEKNTVEFVRAEMRQSTANRSVNNISSIGSGGSPV
ncbi:extracellular calcium-sensing receptor-like isoform X2 [Actinia tenebrosa]|nr:extracellular calcium-sensing receptor-like isoform X2 [Actinia tenebrosa]